MYFNFLFVDLLFLFYIFTVLPPALLFEPFLLFLLLRYLIFTIIIDLLALRPFPLGDLYIHIMISHCNLVL